MPPRRKRMARHSFTRLPRETPLGGRRKSRSHNGSRGRGVAEDDERAASSLPGRTCIPTDLLRTFVAISEFGSFTKAAHLIGLTQPAVTSHMRRLRALVGAEVLHQARRILAINDQIVSGVGLGPNAETVRIGIATLYAGNLAGILRECGRAAHPARDRLASVASPWFQPL